jgi:hypothetical protein
MAWKNERKLHVNDEIWYYAIGKQKFSDCRTVMIRSPKDETYQVRFGTSAITPFLVKEYIEENILGGTTVHS